MASNWRPSFERLLHVLDRESGKHDLWHGYIISSDAPTAETEWGIVTLHEPLAQKEIVGATRFTFQNGRECPGFYFGDPATLALFRSHADACYRCLLDSPLCHLTEGLVTPLRCASDSWLYILYVLARRYPNLLEADEQEICDRAPNPLLPARERVICEMGGDQASVHVRFAFLERDVYSASWAAIGMLLESPECNLHLGTQAYPAEEKPSDSLDQLPSVNQCSEQENVPNEPTLFQLGNWDLTEPGFAKYQSHRFPLEHTNRRLLTCFIRGIGSPIHINRLIAACNSRAEPESFTSSITRLRNHLRQHLRERVAFPEDPILYRDPGGYELILT